MREKLNIQKDEKKEKENKYKYNPNIKAMTEAPIADDRSIASPLTKSQKDDVVKRQKQQPQ